MTKVLTNKSSRILLLITLAAFLLSRVLTLTAFPIFNDEAIYLQYSQAIHDDWQKNKFISMHGEWTDWKPPLQYWMTAPVIECGDDPLVAGRAVTLVVSLLGLVGFYLFTKEFFGEKEALLTAMLYTLCPPVLFQNNQFTAETFLFSTAPFFYLAVLKMMRSKKWNLPWAIVGVALGIALLLLKQSGSLLMAVAVALPLTQLQRGKETAGGERGTGEGMAVGWDWKRFALHCLGIAAVIALSHFAAWLVIPGEFTSTREHFNSRWVMPLPELLRFPMDAWRANLGVVAEYVGAYYSWAMPVLLCAFVGFAIRRKGFPELALALMCLAGACVVIFLLRGFNEYLFNTAIIALLLPLLARTGLLVWDMQRIGRTRLIRVALLVCAGIMVAHWGYQLILMRSSPGKYLERSTPWAVANYLKGWPTGFGMKEIVRLLEKEKRPGVLFADTQWGNPLTTLQVYGRTQFPNLRIVPISKEFLDPSETRKLRDAVRQMGEVHLAIFSADPAGERAQWQRNVEEQMCDTRREIREYPGQTPIIVCSF